MAIEFWQVVPFLLEHPVKLLKLEMGGEEAPSAAMHLEYTPRPSP